MKLVLKGIWAVPVVFGIALMLGVSAVPVYADPPDIVCVFMHETTRVACPTEPQAGQHLMTAQSFGQVCHGDIVFVNTIKKVMFVVFNEDIADCDKISPRTLDLQYIVRGR